MADRISIEIVADDSGLQTTLRRAGRLLQQFSVTTDQLDGSTRAAHGSINKFGQGFRGLVLDMNLARHAMMGFKFAIVDSLAPILKSGAMFERTAALMEGMSKSTDKATRALEVQANTAFLVQKAMSNPFGIQAIQDSMVKLKSIGLDPTAGSLVNFNAQLRTMHDAGSYVIKDTAVNMQALLDSVANFGGSEDQLKRASVAIQQMAGKGVISMEELRQQLGEAVPNAVQLLANSLNMTYGQLVKNISQGKIKAKPALVMLFREMELSMGGSSARMMKTWDGMMSQFSTSWELFKKNIFDSGFGAEMKTQLVGLTNWLNSPEGINAARGLGEAIVAITKAVAGAIHYVIQYKDTIVTLALAFAGFKAAMAMVRFGEFLAGLKAIKMAAVGTALAEMTVAMNAAPSAMARVGIAAKGLGLAMSMVAGPIGVVVALLASAAWSWKSEREEIEKSTAAILAHQLARSGDSDVIAAQRKQLDNFKADLASAEYNIKRFKKILAENRAKSAPQFRIDSNLADIEYYEKMAKEARTRIAAFDEQLDGEELMAAKNAANAELRIIQDKGDQIAQLAAQQYTAQMEANLDKITQAEKEGKNTVEIAKQVAADKLAIENTSFNARLAFIDKMIAEQNAKEKSATVKLAQDTAREVGKTLRQEKARLQDLHSKQENALGQASVNTGSGATPADYLDSLKEKYRVLVAQTVAWGKAQDNTNKEFAKAQDEIGKAQGAKDFGLAADLELWAKKVDALKPTSDDLGAMFKTLEGDSGALEEKLLNLQLAIDMGDSWEKMTSKGQEYTAMLAKLSGVTGVDVAALRSGLMQLKNEDAFAESMKSNIAAMKDLKKETVDWTQDSLNEKDKRKAAYNEDIQKIYELATALQKTGQLTIGAQDEIQSAIAARNAKFVYDNKSALEKWADEWADASTKIDEAFTGAIDSAASTFADFIVTGKADWKSFETMVLKSIAEIIIKKTIAGLVGSAFDMFGGGSYGAGAKVDAIAAPDRVFARGGIMTPGGDLPLRKYANGGVATRPQVALFGEGRQPEAYVPLPDGRSIPVTMKSGDKSAAPNISFNLINQSGQNVQAEQSGVRFDGEKMIMDVVLKGMSKGGKFRDGMKGAR